MEESVADGHEIRRMRGRESNKNEEKGRKCCKYDTPELVHRSSKDAQDITDITDIEYCCILQNPGG